MVPWEKIDRVRVPGQDGDILLLRRGSEFSIRTAGAELMNSRMHGSEDLLAELSIRHIKKQAGLNILIGGLGMGYTLAAALKNSGPDTSVTVAELIPAVIEWNRTHLGHLAGMPLGDERVLVENRDVAELIDGERSRWDIILLDVDNGPEGLTRDANGLLYGRAGLEAAYYALRAGGVLGVWSAGDNESFSRRLKACGFRTEVQRVRARKSGKGGMHIIWLAGRP